MDEQASNPAHARAATESSVQASALSPDVAAPGEPPALPIAPRPVAPSQPLGYSTPPSQPLGYPVPPYAPAPPYGAYPAYPGYPTAPGAQAPAAPTGYSPQPSQPYPPYAGPPSMPLAYAPPPAYAPPSGGYPYPTAPGYPASQGYPTYPGFPMPASMPLPLPVPAAPRPPRDYRLAHPFPRRISAAVAAACVAAVALTYLVAVLLAGQDWAAGTHLAAVAALVLASAAAAGAIVRVALGRRALVTALLAAALVVALAGSGAAGLVGGDQLHAVQARALESAGQWKSAVDEYVRAGEHAPSAPDLARVYDEWGEQALTQGHYGAAIDHFKNALTFAQSGVLSDRGNAGLFHTYTAWVRTNSADVPYLDAFAFFQQYRHSSACTGSCATEVAAIDGQARFQFATQRAQAGDYGTAIIQLEYIQTTDATSSYASQAHSVAPPIYYAYGQQQSAGQYYTADGGPSTSSPGCDLAVEAYQKLVKEYASSPEAKKAAAALAAPQGVTGSFINYPTTPTTTVFLSKSGYSPPCCGTVTGGWYFSNDYSTTLNLSDGTYTFHSVPQGSYHLSAQGPDGSTAWWFGIDNNLLNIPVLPLCPTHVIQFDDKI